jgi:hypothetical protein
LGVGCAGTSSVHGRRAGLSGAHSPFFGGGHGIDAASVEVPVPGRRADGEERGSGGQGVVPPGRGGAVGRGACRGEALYHALGQPDDSRGTGTGQRWRPCSLRQPSGDGGPCGRRTGLLEALRAAAAAERAVRSVERANMVVRSWLGAGGDASNGLSAVVMRRRAGARPFSNFQANYSGSPSRAS